MYEKFTDRARKVITMAKEEAECFSKEYVGTGHILLGLIKEGAGVAAHVLKYREVDLEKIRVAVERLDQSGSSNDAELLHAKKVIEYSLEEVRRLNHNYVGT
jgi:ATP-dependent Clp protease ATP-binding subunit ClpC